MFSAPVFPRHLLHGRRNRQVDSAIGCRGTEGLPQQTRQTTPESPQEASTHAAEKSELVKDCVLLVLDLSFVPYIPVQRLDFFLQQLVHLYRSTFEIPSAFEGKCIEISLVSQKLLCSGVGLCSPWKLGF